MCDDFIRLAKNEPSAIINPMSDIEILRRRIRQRLDDLKRPEREVARRAKVHESTLWAILSGKAGYFPKAKTLKGVATALDVTPEWLTGETDSITIQGSGSLHIPDSKHYGTMTATEAVPVVGTVEAGAFRPVMETVDEATQEYIEIVRHPRFKAFPHIAFTVRGDSMNLKGISDGDTVICVPWADIGIGELTGILVVVERIANGGLLREWTVKEMEARPDRVVLHPRSSNPAHAPIEIMRADHDTGTEVRIIALVVNVLKNAFPF